MSSTIPQSNNVCRFIFGKVFLTVVFCKSSIRKECMCLNFFLSLGHYISCQMIIKNRLVDVQVISIPSTIYHLNTFCQQKMNTPSLINLPLEIIFKIRDHLIIPDDTPGYYVRGTESHSEKIFHVKNSMEKKFTERNEYIRRCWALYSSCQALNHMLGNFIHETLDLEEYHKIELQALLQKAM